VYVLQIAVLVTLQQTFILHDVKLAELSNNSFEYKNVTFRAGVKIYSDHSYIQFSLI